MGKKNEVSGLVSGSATYLFSNILKAAIPLGLLPVLTRYLSTEQYGEVAIFQTLMAVLIAVTGLSVHSAANRKYFDRDNDQKTMQHYVAACLQILVVSTSAVGLVVYFFRHELSSYLALSTSWFPLAVLGSSASFVILLRLGQW